MLPPKETFDLVMAADVLYEPDHPALLAGVLHSRLRPGGRFLGVCSIRQHALLAEFVQRLEVLCVEVEVSPEDTAEMPEFAGLGCWTTQHSSTYIGGIQRISARRRPQSSLVPEEEER
jgi:SAM-dependent methyltransferase